MKVLGTMFLIVFSWALASCARLDQVHSAAEPVAKPQPKLKEMLKQSDMLVVKNFYPVTRIDGPPSKYQFASVGHVDIGPTIAYRQGHDQEKLKGLRIEVVSTYVRANEYSHPESNVSFLDEDEARDFLDALDVQIQTASDWKTHHPDHDVELSFRAKDDFSATLFTLEGDQLMISSGITSSVFQSYPAQKITDIRAKVADAINVLDSH